VDVIAGTGLKGAVRPSVSEANLREGPGQPPRPVVRPPELVLPPAVSSAWIEGRPVLAAAWASCRATERKARELCQCEPMEHGEPGDGYRWEEDERKATDLIGRSDCRD
jgi:hypothetical protein